MDVCVSKEHWGIYAFVNKIDLGVLRKDNFVGQRVKINIFNS